MERYQLRSKSGHSAFQSGRHDGLSRRAALRQRPNGVMTSSALRTQYAAEKAQSGGSRLLSDSRPAEDDEDRARFVARTMKQAPAHTAPDEQQGGAGVVPRPRGAQATVTIGGRPNTMYNDLPRLALSGEGKSGTAEGIMYRGEMADLTKARYSGEEKVAR